jgi:hypothetical protein
LGYGGETLYYRDTSARLPDGRWQAPLLKALKEECNVLLALYTPGYFRQKANEKCYCGRELSLFLRRAGGGLHLGWIWVIAASAGFTACVSVLANAMEYALLISRETLPLRLRGSKRRR